MSVGMRFVLFMMTREWAGYVPPGMPVFSISLPWPQVVQWQSTCIACVPGFILSAAKTNTAIAGGPDSSQVC